jgi:hypothetical protein
MSPVTHFLSGWVLASAFSRQLGKSGKTIVVLASVAPDIDGLGIIPGHVDCMETRRITASICFRKSRPGANTSPAHAFL